MDAVPEVAVCPVCHETVCAHFTQAEKRTIQTFGWRGWLDKPAELAGFRVVGMMRPRSANGWPV